MELPGRFMPVFLLLLLLPKPAASGCASSLGYKFTITLNGQPWCVIQGQVNGKNFFNYTCNHQEIKFMGGQGMEVNETQAWNQQRDTLKDVMEDLKKALLDIRWNIKTSGPLSLQGSMMCKQESSGGTSPFWKLDFIELLGAAGGEVSPRIFLHLDSKKSRTALHGEDRLLNKIVGPITDLLNRISVGDCGKWLQQVLCPQDELLSTKAAPTTANATATVPSKATTNTHITLIVSVILTCLVIVGW
ncbi:PREDICTED: NKG2D ligand 2-like [Miniopterus natalensis]|uniref:NKG2D ligand 2-like n=1 Tax=Miniopterus natalensis TaxID=291302 RepID=UPI0007A6C473|nr:PREDICTED: NKG2D ligand 2-like [Miniopterus natalensis]